MSSFVRHFYTYNSVTLLLVIYLKKNIFIYLVIAVSIGFIIGEVVYSDYLRNLDNTKYNAYLIQIGSFNNDIEVDPSKYLVLKENGIYNVYAGITTKLSNATKIKELYEEDNIESVIKPTVIDNVEFISNLKQFDILLSDADDRDNLISINDVIISRYEELILGK